LQIPDDAGLATRILERGAKRRSSRSGTLNQHPRQ
jgi:hypothetical protein